MPRIHWTKLPEQVKEHLLDRLRTRALNARDMTALLEWIRTNPEVPDGPWCKDFGAFKLVGHGSVPNTFLERDQACFGERI
jgi:hypothetical protein